MVYVNYGRYDDFKLLLEKNINCSGKIVIARYGHVFRGDKVKNDNKPLLSNKIMTGDLYLCCSKGMFETRNGNFMKWHYRY